MNKLQASLRDRSARAWGERKLMYKIGSAFKGCSQCGIVEEVPGTEKVRFTTGTSVYRAYYPKAMGWTYRCHDCGATDLQCWSGAIDIGKEPILGVRSVVQAKKMAMRRQHEKNRRAEQAVELPSNRLAELNAEIARLEKILKERSK